VHLTAEARRGRLVVAGLVLRDAQAVERPGFPALVSQNTVDLKRLLVSSHGRREVSGAVPDRAELVQGIGLAEPVAEVTVYIASALVRLATAAV
jgi:hypothetical protein